jgi:hypothetical protein
MRLSSHHHRLDVIRGLSSVFKDSHMTVHLVDPALTRDVGGDGTWEYNKSVRSIML